MLDFAEFLTDFPVKRLVLSHILPQSGAAKSLNKYFIVYDRDDNLWKEVEVTHARYAGRTVRKPSRQVGENNKKTNYKEKGAYHDF